MSASLTSSKQAIVGRLLRTLMCLMLWAGSYDAAARQDAIRVGAGQQAIRGTAMALYQSYEEDSLSASQLSIPISVIASLGSDVSLSLHVSQMSTSGDLEDLGGLSDAQLILSYARRIGSGSVVLSLGANLPTGKKDLSVEEFKSIIRISQRAYDFRVPSLGQGFGLSPSITWAVPVGANTAIGVGASYQVRGSYRPMDILTQDYTPGNEILLTGGIDTRIDARSALALDVSHSIYAADQLGEIEVYEAGGKTTISALYRYVIGFDELRLAGIYRTRAKSSELSGGELVVAGSQTLPNQINLLASYRKRVQEDLEIVALLEGRFFDEIEGRIVDGRDLYPKRSMVDIGILPSYRLSPEATLVGRFVYTIGTITGFEVGAGLAISL